MGFDVPNDIFAENAWYFRNALLRAKYSNFAKGVYATTEYLELFLRNLLLGEDNILSNRELHIGYKETPVPYEKLKKREESILSILKESPDISLQEVADKIGRSLRTVKIAVKSLQEQGRLERVGGKKKGSWKVID